MHSPSSDIEKVKENVDAVEHDSSATSAAGDDQDAKRGNAHQEDTVLCDQAGRQVAIRNVAPRSPPAMLASTAGPPKKPVLAATNSRPPSSASTIHGRPLFENRRLHNRRFR